MSGSVSLIDGHIDIEPRLKIKPYDKCKVLRHCSNYGDFDCPECITMCDKYEEEMLQVAEFCLDCFRKIEPNANEINTKLSGYLVQCESCGEHAHIVTEYIEHLKCDCIKK